MIVLAGPLDAPADRLLAALAKRGATVLESPEALPEGDEPVTLALSTGPFVLNLLALVRSLGRRPFRVLMLSRLGAGPQARSATLQRLWRIEEHVRRSGAPALTLRFAPLVGLHSPLWNKLRNRPLLLSGGGVRLEPVAESDALLTLERALAEPAPWSGAWEVAGARVWTLRELRELASAAGRVRERGAWEPSLDEMAEHRAASGAAWAERFALTPMPIETCALEGAA